MKKLLSFSLCLLSILISFSQTQPKTYGGEYKFQQNSPCLSDEQRTVILTEIQNSRIKLINDGILKDTSPNGNQSPLAHPLFIWPLVKNPTAPYTNTWSISNFVDHDPNYPNQLQDWNCGTRTYDTSDGYNHQGTDIFTWPFSWYQFQNNQSWAVAAADGVIVYKSDGNFDMNCAFNNGTWNAVYVQHADGSTAWYGHLKKGSLTTKLIGDSVVAGEFLGVVGSSGNSTGPHLHFEIYNSLGQLVDPYSGPCNNWASGTDTWWINQKPYQDPKINAVLTHSAVPVFNNCPETESTFLSDDFSNGNSVVCAIYLADQLPNTFGTVKLIRPDGSLAFTFDENFTSFYYSSYWYWSFLTDIFNQNGVWTFSFTYLGNTVNHNFNYGTLSNAEFSNNLFSVFPNPSKSVVNIKSNNNNAIDEISLFDIVGKKVFYTSSNTSQIDLSALSKGVYLIHIVSDGSIYTNKIVKD